MSAGTFTGAGDLARCAPSRGRGRPAESPNRGATAARVPGARGSAAASASRPGPPRSGGKDLATGGANPGIAAGHRAVAARGCPGASEACLCAARASERREDSMNCRRAARLLCFDAGEDLDARRRSAVAEHVAICPTCCSFRDELSATLETARSLEVPALEHGREELRRRVWREIQ